MSLGTLVRQYKKQLPVRLLAEESAEYAKELTTLMKEEESLENEAKSSASAFKSRIKTMSGRINHLRDVVDDGEIEKDVKVSEYHDAFKRKATVYREDNGATVSERDLTEAELTAIRQGQLKLAEVQSIKQEG